MNFWTLPRRIQAGFATLVLLTAFVGALCLWRINGIGRNVDMMANNSVPSVVSINRVIQTNFIAARSARRAMLDAAENMAAARSVIEDCERVIHEGDELIAAYPALLVDDEERRLFRDAVPARDRLLEVVRGAMVLIGDGKVAEAKVILQERLDSVIAEAQDKFNAIVKFNADRTDLEAAKARRNVQSSTLAVALTLAAATALAAALATLIVRSAARAMQGISAAIEGNATQTATASGQLSSASRALAAGCSEQGSSVAETSASLEEMSTMIKSTADNAAKAKELAGQARAAAETGAQTMVTMNEAMRAIEVSSGEVAKIVKNIDEIAFQTNILALNAAVEAARAGEAGAGFAVVADEVRALAQRSAAAARETADRIEAAIAKSRHGSASCGRVGESLAEIAEKVAAADSLVAEIATAAHEQTQGIRQIGQAMAQMDGVTRSNAGRAEETASAAAELNSQAHFLQESVDFLRGFFMGTARSGAAGRAAGVRVGAAAEPSPRQFLPGPASRDAEQQGCAVRPTAASAERVGGSSAAPLPASVRIPMPGDAGAHRDPSRGSFRDDEDRHFTNF
jgi:methyl-accepting chemotaxis protein